MDDVLILGAGPAGLMTALILLDQKPFAAVTLVDCKDKVGGKIPGSGNGRCNFSNRDVQASDYFSRAGIAPIASILDTYSVERTLNYFASLGLVWREEEGRFYPASFESKVMLQLLRDRAIEKGAKLQVDVDAQLSLKATKHGWTYGPFSAKYVVIAVGSPAGRPRKNYKLPKLPKLNFIPWSPGLVPLVCFKPFKRLSGTRIRGTLKAHFKDAIQTSNGEILLTNYGLSGIASQDLATTIALPEKQNQSLPLKHLGLLGELTHMIYGISKEQDQLILSLNMFPEWDDECWKWQVTERLKDGQKVPDLRGLLPMKMQSLIYDLWPKLQKLSLKKERLFYYLLHDFPFIYKETRDYELAQVAAGGLDLRDFEPQSLEHKQYPGLYAAGEILDVVGRCGGFNLQWAWSSAQTVGYSIAEALVED